MARKHIAKVITVPNLEERLKKSKPKVVLEKAVQKDRRSRYGEKREGVSYPGI